MVVSKERFFIRGLGEICVDDVEYLFCEDLKLRIEEHNKDFYTSNKDKQLIAIRRDGSVVIVNDNSRLTDYLGCDFQFVDEQPAISKAKPQIRIRNRSVEQITYTEEHIPDLSDTQPSYKNSEVAINVKEILFLSISAVESILTTIGWDSECNSNIVEQAGLLVGNRYKDSSGSVWGKVSHIIPLKETPSSRRGILMTSDSFYEASTQAFPKLKESNPNVEIIGWYHTHTYSDQPVFSATDYQAQSTTFGSYQSWFALVLNAQQRSFSAYYGKNATLIKAFFESSEEIESKWSFGINEKYYGSEQKAKIQMGAYVAEQQKLELEKLRRDLEERERKLNKEASTLQIQEQKLLRERENLFAEKKQFEIQKRTLQRQQSELSKKQSELNRTEKHLSDSQETLKRIFPLAFEENSGIISRMFSSLLPYPTLRERRITSTRNLNDEFLDEFYNPFRSTTFGTTDIGVEMMNYGKTLNALQHIMGVLTNTKYMFCAIVDYNPGPRFLLRSIIPERELQNVTVGNTAIFAIDRHNREIIADIRRKLSALSRGIVSYVYIEEYSTVFKIN